MHMAARDEEQRGQAGPPAGNGGVDPVDAGRVERGGVVGRALAGYEDGGVGVGVEIDAGDGVDGRLVLEGGVGAVAEGLVAAGRAKQGSSDQPAVGIHRGCVPSDLGQCRCDRRWIGLAHRARDGLVLKKDLQRDQLGEEALLRRNREAEGVARRQRLVAE